MDDTSRRMNATVGGRAVEETRGYAVESPEQADERTRQIRDEIEDTRGEMTETIDAIQEKLKPRNIVANATERVTTATTERVREVANTIGDSAEQAMEYTRETANSIVTTARENPIPLALIGVGAAWWLTNWSRRSASSFGRTTYGRSDRPDYSREYRAARQPLATGARMSSLATPRQEYARRRTHLRRTGEQNPLLVGAGALMIGAAFGLALPETETENEWMGETRDNVMDRARDIARDAANQVQEAAGSLADEAKKVTEKLQP
jgi:hypothetical protein